MTFTQIAPLLRHLLQIASGYLMAKGLVDETLATELVGLGMSAATVAWYFWAKRK